jgi:hypothetical protein
LRRSISGKGATNAGPVTKTTGAEARIRGKCFSAGESFDPSGASFIRTAAAAGRRTGKGEPMKRMVVRYKAKPERAAENQRLIEAVFRELDAKAPEDFRYLALRLADGSFLHFVERDETADPLGPLEAFRAFQSGIKERVVDPPAPSEATIVGNYRMLDR